MIKLIGAYDIPDWAIPYLVNGDSEGLSEEEIKAVDDFEQDLIQKYNAKYIDVDIAVMNEEKYGNYYHTEHDLLPAFGRVFGATETWRLPVWVGIDDDTQQEFNIVTMGYNLERKFELNTFEHHKFVDMEEAEIWAETYFLYLNDFEYYVHPSEEAVYNIEP